MNEIVYYHISLSSSFKKFLPKEAKTE
jgi:hypothetical protein